MTLTDEPFPNMTELLAENRELHEEVGAYRRIINSRLPDHLLDRHKTPVDGCWLCERDELRAELELQRDDIEKAREVLNSDAYRLAAGITCQPGQPGSCEDFHNAGQCCKPAGERRNVVADGPGPNWPATGPCRRCPAAKAGMLAESLPCTCTDDCGTRGCAAPSTPDTTGAPA